MLNRARGGGIPTRRFSKERCGAADKKRDRQRPREREREREIAGAMSRVKRICGLRFKKGDIFLVGGGGFLPSGMCVGVCGVKQPIISHSRYHQCETQGSRRKKRKEKDRVSQWAREPRSQQSRS